MTEPTMATLLEADGRVALRFVRSLAHPREKVWRAITESEHLQHWMPCDLVGDRAEGASLEVPFWPEHVRAYGLESTPTLTGEVLVWQPPEVFEWMWSTDRLRWELEPDGDGTRLTFTTWLGEVGHGVEKTAAGYHVCLDQLAELLDTGGVARPLAAVDPGPLEAQYAEVL
jgi:uncharacterized protein YndB with AHSA1/START domain